MFTEQGRILYRPDEAARALAISRATLYTLLARGELRAVRIGRAARIPAIELQRWLGERLGAEQSQ